MRNGLTSFQSGSKSCRKCCCHGRRFFSGLAINGEPGFLLVQRQAGVVRVLGWVQHVRSRRAQDRSFCSGHGPDTVVAILISLQNQIPRTGRPGPYEVKVSAKGFTTALQSNLTLAVGAQQQLNIPMKVGETSQTVQVTEAAPQIELTSSTISDQIESTTVTELPLNGRDWAALATLSPGVNAVEVQMPFETGARRGNRGFGAQLTISGGKPTQNNYRLDGLSINDYANAGPGSVLGVNLGGRDSRILRAHRQLLGRIWESLR